MKKRLWLLCLISVLCLCCLCTGCDSNDKKPDDTQNSTQDTTGDESQSGTTETDPNHTHTYAAEWSSDEEYHWYGTTCEHTDVVKDKAAHSWNDGEVTKEASCSTAGERTFTCTDCGYKKIETISETGHITETLPSVSATCTTVGKTEGMKCRTCGEIIIAQEEIAALGHTEVVDKAVAATCTANGLSDGKHCSVCNEILVAQTEVSALGHTEVVDVAVAPTCITTGLTEGRHCSVCNDVLIAQQEIAKTDHTETIIQAIAATCSAEGATEGKKCSVCDEILVAPQPIGKLAHTEITVAGVAPSCSAEGLTTGKKCSVCEAIIVAQEPIEKLPHTEETVPAVSATCKSTGLTEGKKCSVCQEVLVAQMITQKVAHNYVPVVTAPLCEEEGYTTHTCSMCDDSYVDSYVNALGHTWGAWEASGSNTLRYCSNECGKYQRVMSVSAAYNGIRLLTGESVWKDDVSVVATLMDGTTVTVADFTLENDVMQVDGSNYVTVKFYSLSTSVAVPAIYANLPGTTANAEFTYTTEGDAVTITGFVGSSTDIIIPAHINRIPVRYIEENVFNGKENLKSVTIPNSIHNIGANAFNGCKRITALTLGTGLQEIGLGAFAGCVSLTELTIPANVKTLVGPYWSDDAGVFENCTGLVKVIIGDDVTDFAETVIGARSFKNCTALKELYVGSNVVEIEESAFENCTLLETIIFNENLLTIGNSAFSGDENIKSVAVPNSVYSIGTNAFYNCKRINSLVLGTGLNEIGFGAFASCVSLKEVVIPANVKTIIGPYWSDDSGAFENCTGLSKVTIGDNTADFAETVIGIRAFKNCTSLKEVYIGSNVLTIDEAAFAYCTSLETLTLEENLKNINLDAFYANENLKSLSIPNSVNIIGDNAFIACIRMTSVTFGSGLQQIGFGAFAGCVSLTELTIPANVKMLVGPYWSDDSGVFENCVGLVKVTIGDDTADFAETIIGTRAFKNCTALKELYIGSNVLTIEESAFENCVALETLALEENINTIGANAFYGNENIKSLVVPNSVYSIGSNAFYNCKRMEALTFGTGLTEIGFGAFYNCVTLTELTIPVNVKTIDGPYWSDDAGAFENCTGLVKVTIGDDTADFAETTIGNDAFKNCISLEEVYFGSNVLSVDEEAFSGCILLTKINFGSGAQSVASNAFSECIALMKIEIPANVLVIENEAFNGCNSLETVIVEIGNERERSFDGNAFQGCNNLDRIYYKGTADSWQLIEISEDAIYPLNVTPYYYTSNAPTSVDNYWYYNNNNEPRVWNVSDVAFEAEYSAENFTEIFGGEDSSYSTTFYNSLKDDSGFQTGLMAWETLHIVADTSFSEGVWQVSKKDLYKLVIYDLLCGEANAQETILSDLESSKYAYFKEFVIEVFGKEVAIDVLEATVPSSIYTPKLADYAIAGVDYIFESSKNMYDALMTCATYMVLSDMDASFQAVLLQIANDSSNPYDLREAAREYAEVFQMSTAEILANFAVDYATADEKAAFAVFSDLLWDKTVELVFPEFAVIQATAKGLLFLADLGWNVDGIYNAYYKLDVAVHLEAALRDVIHNTLPDYYRVSNYAEAETYVYAIGMYKTSVLLGFDYSNAFLSEYSHNLSDEEKAECSSIMGTISSLKQDKNTLYEKFDGMIDRARVAYYS